MKQVFFLISALLVLFQLSEKVTAAPAESSTSENSSEEVTNNAVNTESIQQNSLQDIKDTIAKEARAVGKAMGKSVDDMQSTEKSAVDAFLEAIDKIQNIVSVYHDKIVDDDVDKMQSSVDDAYQAIVDAIVNIRNAIGNNNALFEKIIDFILNLIDKQFKRKQSNIDSLQKNLDTAQDAVENLGNFLQSLVNKANEGMHNNIDKIQEIVGNLWKNAFNAWNNGKE